jgi:hypothetical protein
MRRAGDLVLSLDDEKKEMKDLFNSFDIAPLGGGEPLVKMRYAQYGPIVVSEVTHGGDVWVKPADNRSGYHVMFPLNGRVETRYLGEDIVATGGTAVLYRPAGPVFTRLGAGARVVNVIPTARCWSGRPGPAVRPRCAPRSSSWRPSRGAL